MKKFITYFLVGVMALTGVPAAIACNGVQRAQQIQGNAYGQNIVQRIVLLPIQGVAYTKPQIQQEQEQVQYEQNSSCVQQDQAVTHQSCAQNLLSALNVQHGYAVQQVIVPHQNFIQHSQAIQVVQVRNRGKRQRVLFNGNFRKRVQRLFQNFRNRQQNRIVRVGQIQQLRNFNRVNQLNFRADRKITNQLFIQQQNY